ncbi:MAG: VanW family protein [Clostridiales bacterium]|nr:VanW family protein [Clostridiales bacterium]
MKKVDARSSGAGDKRADKAQKNTEKQLAVKKEPAAKLSIPAKTGKASTSSKQLAPAAKKEKPAETSNDFDYSMLGVTSKKRQQQKTKQAQAKQKARAAEAKSRTRSGKPRTPLAIIIMTPLVVVAALATFYLWYLVKTGYFKETIVASMADGTTANLFVEDALAYITTDKFFKGTVIDGIDVGGMTKEQAKAAVVANQPKSPEQVKISLSLDGKEYDLDFSNVSFEYNTDDVINEAYALYRLKGDEDNSTLTEYFNGVQALTVDPKEYQTAYTVKHEGVEETVKELLEKFHLEPVNASISTFDVDSRAYTIIPEKKGYNINIPATTEKVKAMLDSRNYVGVVPVEAEIIAPEITEASINATFGKISSCTSKTTRNSNRNNNIKKACQYMNGYILKPGKEFSFNKVVGQRTAARGFKEAKVIAGGQYEMGLGGGICQVSSTLYNAVICAGLSATERHPHAFPSTYLPMGQDATVDWPHLDFKFKNTTDGEIIIVAWWSKSDRVVHIELYGKKLPDGQKIKFESKTTSKGKTPSTVEYVEDPDMKAGETEVVRSAHYACTVVSYQVWYDKDGKEIKRKKVSTSNFRAYTKKVAVGTLLDNGKHAKLDTKTGKLSGLPTATPKPTKATKATTKPAENA